MKHITQSTFPTVNAHSKNTCQITEIWTNTRSTHYIMYKVASLEWSKSVQWGTCKSDSRKPERLFVKAEDITVKFHFCWGKKHHNQRDAFSLDVILCVKFDMWGSVGGFATQRCLAGASTTFHLNDTPVHVDSKLQNGSNDHTIIRQLNLQTVF